MNTGVTISMSSRTIKHTFRSDDSCRVFIVFGVNQWLSLVLPYELMKLPITSKTESTWLKLLHVHGICFSLEWVERFSQSSGTSLYRFIVFQTLHDPWYIKIFVLLKVVYFREWVLFPLHPTIIIYDCWVYTVWDTISEVYTTMVSITLIISTPR